MDIYRTLNKNINAKAPLDEYFDLIYTREDVSKIKPDPEVYQKLSKNLMPNQKNVSSLKIH